MDIILLSCSGDKSEGGIKNYPNRSVISSYLSPKSFLKLMMLRQKLAKQIGEKHGPDIGNKVEKVDFLFMPAYKRYTGILYESCNFSHLYPKIKDLKILIISALYGVIDANDYIREYDWHMDCNLPNGRKTSTWWKNNGLGEILLEIVDTQKPTKIYDFLFKKYQMAILSFYKTYANRNIRRIPTKPGFNSIRSTGQILSKVIKEYL